MTPEEFRQAYFEQYAEDGDVCDDAWFESYFDNSNDWLEVEYRALDEGFTVYSDPESDLGGFWAATSGGAVEGPFQSMAEVAVSLGYSPRNFPPDSDGDAEDDFDDDLNEDEDEDEAPDFEEDVEDDEDFEDGDDEGDEDEDDDD